MRGKTVRAACDLKDALYDSGKEICSAAVRNVLCGEEWITPQGAKPPRRPARTQRSNARRVMRESVLLPRHLTKHAHRDYCRPRYAVC